jgi:hypothetical protein
MSCIWPDILAVGRVLFEFFCYKKSCKIFQKTSWVELSLHCINFLKIPNFFPIFFLLKTGQNLWGKRNTGCGVSFSFLWRKENTDVILQIPRCHIISCKGWNYLNCNFYHSLNYFDKFINFLFKVFSSFINF